MVWATQPEFDPKKSQQIRLFQRHGTHSRACDGNYSTIKYRQGAATGWVRADVSLTNIYYL
jgi:hypothetical protein